MNIDKLNEFDVSIGFRFAEAHEQTAECSDGGTASVITLHFGNDFHVAAVVDFIDGEPHIIELDAVDDNGKKI